MDSQNPAADEATAHALSPPGATDTWRLRLKATARRPFWILSPTWGLANVLKPERDKEGRAAMIRRLNWIYLLSSLAILAATIACSRNQLTAIRPTGYVWWSILLQYPLLSRFLEVAYAFLHDAFEKLEKPGASSALGWGERVLLAMRSYLELVSNFALIYALLPASAWLATQIPPPPGTVTDLIWYSANVITTSGGGGYVPADIPLKLLSVGEVLCGVILLVVSFTIYVSRALGGVPAPMDAEAGGGGPAGAKPNGQGR